MNSSGFMIETKPLFKKKDFSFFQIVELRLDRNIKPGKASVSINTSKWNRRFDLKIEDINESKYIEIPEIQKIEKAFITIEQGKYFKKIELELKPRPKYHIYIINFSHTDVGYTDIPGKVTKIYKKSIKMIIDYFRETTHPENNPYRWNVESGYWLENAIDGLCHSDIIYFNELIKKDLIELLPLYLAHPSDYNDEESIIRSFYYVLSFAKKINVKIKSAMSTDAPGMGFIYPKILNNLGIRYLSTALNITMAKPLALPRPFYWASPDGSKILLYNSDPRQQYQEGVMLGINKNYDDLFKKLTSYLQILQDENQYNYEILALRNTGFSGDNTLPNFNVCSVVKQWNKIWEFPKLYISTSKEFFQDFEKRYSKKIDIFSGAWPDWWSNYFGSSAYEAGVNRQTHEDLHNSERVNVLNYINYDKNFSYPEEEINNLYKKLFLADEGFLSSSNSVSEPHSLQTKGQRFWQLANIYETAIRTKQLLKDSLCYSNNPPENNYKIIVYNLLEWERIGIVEISIDDAIIKEKKILKIIDNDNKEELRFQLIDRSVNDIKTAKTRVAFCVNNIPPLGFKTYNVLFSDNKYENMPAYRNVFNENVLENIFYKIRFNDKGDICSIFDKELGKDIIDKNSHYNFNQFIYEKPKGKHEVNLSTKLILDDYLYLQDFLEEAYDLFYYYPKISTKFERISPKRRRIKHIKEGYIYSELVISSSLPLFPKIENHIILDNITKRIKIKNNLEKNQTLNAEALYCAFPFKGNKPRFNIFYQGDTFEPETGQLPGSCKDWYMVQKYLDISDNDVNIIFSPIEARLIQLGNINTGKWLDNISIDNGTIFSYIMNNYWWTNTVAGQGGEYCFNYSITSKKPPFDSIRSYRFGMEQHVSLIGLLIDGKKMIHDKQKLFDYIPDNISIIGIKKKEEGEGLVIRFLELANIDTKFNLKLVNNKIKKASIINFVEDYICNLALNDGCVELSIGPKKIVNIHLELLV